VEMDDITVEKEIRNVWQPRLEDYAVENIKVMMQLGGPVKQPGETWDEFIENRAERAKFIVQSLGSLVHAYEVWNEPDNRVNTADYDPAIPPEVYGKYMHAMYHAIKAMNPRALVLSGGFDSGSPSWVARVMAASPQKQLWADITSVHVYGNKPFGAWPSEEWGNGKGKSPTYADGALMASHMTGRPVWISETGLKTKPNDQNLSQFPKKIFQALETVHQVAPVAFWYAWTDAMKPGFGLLTDSGAKKNTYVAFQNYCTKPLDPEVQKDWPLLGKHSSV